jgi:predicted enzyme related to lactoylglutathione lyase
MRKIVPAIAAVLLAAAPLAALGQGQVTVRSVRVGAADVFKTAAFYEAVFGLKEIRRVDREDLKESILNFGKTTQEATANTGTKVVIISKPANAPADPVSHLIFQVSDVAAVVAKATANGGPVERQPSRSATSGSMVAFILDPAGNRIELIQPPA